MSKILAKLKKLFSFKDLINEDISFAFNEKFSNFLSYLLPENFNEIKKSFLLFWFIASFTLIFLIWAYFAEFQENSFMYLILMPFGFMYHFKKSCME